AIVRVKSDARIELNRPWPDCFRESDLGFKRPAIGADVHQLVPVVLTQRRGNAQTRAEDEILVVVLELRRRQRGCADEIHRKAKCRVRKTVNVTGMWRTEDEAFRGD